MPKEFSEALLASLRFFMHGRWWIFLKSARCVVSSIAISDVQCGALGTRRATGWEETDERGGPFCSRSTCIPVCVRLTCTDMRIVMSITNEDSRQGRLSQAAPAAVTAARVLSRVHKTCEETAINPPPPLPPDAWNVSCCCRCCPLMPASVFSTNLDLINLRALLCSHLLIMNCLH